MILLAAVLPAPSARAETPPECTVRVRLTSISCSGAHDAPEAESKRDPVGEYYVRLNAGREVGPFELRSGDQSSFWPGLLLQTIETGIGKPEKGDEISLPVAFNIAVVEDDSTPQGEDGANDRSIGLHVNERVQCPGSTTITRHIKIPQNPPRGDDGKRKKPDTIKLSIKIVAGS